MNRRSIKAKLLCIFLMILGGGMSTNSMGGVGDFAKEMAARVLEPRHASWKEEVLLHDGRKLIVERSQSYGGRHEIGQRPPVKEQKLTFTLPGSNRSITWKSEYSEDVERANLNLLALHVLNDSPYIVAEPNLCLAYNKWGRPNPPYVFFRFDGKGWKRIPLSEFPVEFKSINVVINTLEHAEGMSKQGVVTASDVRGFNSSLLRYPSEHAEYKTIVRQPLAKERCPQYPSGPKAPFPDTPAPPK